MIVWRYIIYIDKSFTTDRIFLNAAIKANSVSFFIATNARANICVIPFFSEHVMANKDMLPLTRGNMENRLAHHK